MSLTKSDSVAVASTVAAMLGAGGVSEGINMLKKIGGYLSTARKWKYPSRSQSFTNTSRMPRTKRSTKTKTRARSGRSYTKTRKKRKGGCTVLGLKGQVRELKRMAEADMGTLIYRDKEAKRYVCSENVQFPGNATGMSISVVQEALAQLRYYDPSTPTTLVVADGDSGSFQKEFYVKRSYAHLLLRNNYKVPVNVTVYVCTPKVDTSIDPVSAWSNGLTDSSNGSTSNLNIFPSDSEQFKDLWNVVKSSKKYLNAGSSMTISHASKCFQYDPSLVDSHALQYQKKFGAFVFMTVISGVVGHHPTTANLKGIMECGVDLVLDRTLELRYAAGADIKYTYVTEDLGAVGSTGVVSNKAAVTNQAFALN